MAAAMRRRSYRVLLAIEPGLAPHRVAHSPHVPPLQRPADALEDRRGGGLLAPGVLPGQVLVRRHHPGVAAAVVEPLVRVVHRLHRAYPVYLAPVRHVHRRRRGHVVPVPAARRRGRRRRVVPPELVHDPRRRPDPGVLERKRQPAARGPAPPPPAAAAAAAAPVLGGERGPPQLRALHAAVLPHGVRPAAVRRGPDVVLVELGGVVPVGGGPEAVVAVAVAPQQALAPAGRQSPAFGHRERPDSGEFGRNKTDPRSEIQRRIQEKKKKKKKK
ncbi:hypothetical protein EUGRSUZ_E04058 [Eucalyptus grandis]|uniref:Uncharacterized protein n=2 Tax=Eucalyptus grandis TaxID=71139 RepID=A0ACC3L151_EUCGR|nr:hypothetical protein EUGRSUZ_E04058 [Eucalyptus grandis]